MSHNDGREVVESETVFLHERNYFIQQSHAVCAFVCRIGVGKEFADISSAERAEYGVHYRVYQYVCVGVPDESFVVGNICRAPTERKKRLVLAHTRS